jgi:hypothetical protein
MSNLITGGPAFPAPAGVSHITEQGMTLRDYFAAKAMQVMAVDTHENIMEWLFDADDMPSDLALAKAAYLIADAMLEARNK